MKKSAPEILADNLRLLIRQAGGNKSDLARRSGVSLRMIYHLLNCERVATIDVTEKLAAVFGLQGWQLLLPNLGAYLQDAGRLDAMVDCYAEASEAGRRYIERVAEQEAIYNKQAKSGT